MDIDEMLNQTLKNLDSSINNIASESTSSDVSEKMEYINDEILIMRQRLQEAIENKDLKKIKKICDNGIIILKKYYTEIEDIPENIWENIGMRIFKNIIFFANLTVSIASFIIGIKMLPKNALNTIVTFGSAFSIISDLISKLESSINHINYSKINDKYFGNKNRKGGGNEIKEKSLKIINDNISILEKIRKEI